MNQYRVTIEYVVDAEDEDGAIDEALLGGDDASYVEVYLIGESE